MQLLEQTRSVHARELTELAESCKQRLHDEVEHSRHELVRTLGEQIQVLPSLCTKQQPVTSNENDIC